jgi:hypothetical protein
MLFEGEKPLLALRIMRTVCGENAQLLNLKADGTRIVLV